MYYLEELVEAVVSIDLHYFICIILKCFSIKFKLIGITKFIFIYVSL